MSALPRPGAVPPPRAGRARALRGVGRTDRGGTPGAVGGSAAAAGGLTAAALAHRVHLLGRRRKLEPQRHLVRSVGAFESLCRGAASLVRKLFGGTSAFSYGRQAGSAPGRSIVGRRRRGSDRVRGAGRRQHAQRWRTANPAY